MARNDPEARQRNGAIPERQLDGSVTLYGVEDWTQLHDDPVLEIVQRTGSADPESDKVDDHFTDATPDGDDDREGDDPSC